MCYISNMKVSYRSLFIIPAALCILSGCVNTPESSGTPRSEPKTNIVEKAVSTIAVPADGFSWHELAEIASQRDGKTQLAALQINRSTLQNQLDLTWRDPQLRLNSSFYSEDDYTHGGNNSHEDAQGYGTALRFYTSNPFVNRWIKKQGAKNARSILAKSRELSYAVYCETKMKCCEAAILEDQLKQLKESQTLHRKICDCYNELRTSGQAAPLKIIKADIKLAKTELQIEKTGRELRNVIYQLAQLTGVDAEKIKVQPLEKQKLSDPAKLNCDDLTIAAVEMRPDLESIRAEIDLAKTKVEIAKAKQIPWFEFLEAGYRNRSEDVTSYTGSGQRNSDAARDEWLLRTAVSLPVFSWAGHETALAAAVVRETQLREAIALTSIRAEIRNALDNYSDAFAARTKMQTEVDSHIQEFNKAVRELDNSKAVIETEILATEELINSYGQSVRENLYNCYKLKLYLDSVTGGQKP